MTATNERLIGRGWAFPPQIDGQGRVGLTTAQNEIEQAIRIILGTTPGERVMRPNFGARLHELAFAPLNTETLTLARRFVEDALKMWEPRIELLDVQVVADNRRACLLIAIEYEIKRTHDRRTLVYPYYVIPSE
ncbi:MAG TPA: GPW/gp25 family protein [Chloroflexi bacterium]|nr:GPW/gp25 family protein [Chloroflexota bacterium]